MIHSFSSFVDAHLSDLRDRFGMAMWCLVRKRGNDWLALHTVGSGYPLTAGDHLAWRDSLCSRRPAPHEPALCPDIHQEAIYRNAPAARQFGVRAYLSLPLHDHNSAQFGTLCAFDPEPRPLLEERHVRTALQRQGLLLETALSWSLAGLDGQRISEFFDEESRDPETALLDGPGWHRVLERERHRCRVYGLQASVLQLHGEGLAPDQREPMADSLAALIREHDMAAHFGNGEFTVLLADTDLPAALGVRNRILDALNAKGLLVRCDAAALVEPQRPLTGG